MSNRVRLPEIDFIKGLAIFSVILLHTLSADVRASLFAIFHIGQAVPIFIAITFFLSFRSIEKGEISLRKWYSVIRIKAVFQRIILPVFLISILQIAVMIAFGRNDLIHNMMRGGMVPEAIICGYIFNYGFLFRSYIK